MNLIIQLFLIAESASFTLAAAIHSGIFAKGYEHGKARIAEGIIAAVLFVGWALCLVFPQSIFEFGFLAQSFAFVGTLIGIAMVAIGVGPQTKPDIIYHLFILILLGWGLYLTYNPQSFQAVTGMIITGLLDLHSSIRYIILILIAGSLYAAYRGWFQARPYTNIDRKWHLLTRIFLNIQMLIGLILYVLKGYYYAWGNLDLIQGMFGFFSVAHIIGMVIGISLINIGFHKAEESDTDEAKFKRIAIFYSIGLLVIFLMIPWPFLHSWATWF